MSKSKMQEQKEREGIELESLIKLQKIFDEKLSKALVDASNEWLPVIMDFMLPLEITKRGWKEPTIYAVQLIFKKRDKPSMIKLNNEIQVDVDFEKDKTERWTVSPKLLERFDKITAIRAVNNEEGRHCTLLFKEEIVDEKRVRRDFKVNIDVSKAWPIIDVGKDVMQCETCGRWFLPDPTNAWRQKYCRKKCRYDAGNERKKKK